jgi:malonate decarboxylase beta subunit
VRKGLPPQHRSQQVNLYRARIAALDTANQINPSQLRQIWSSKESQGGKQ